MKDQQKIKKLKGKIQKLHKDVVKQKKTEKKAIKKLIKIEEKSELKLVANRVKKLKKTLEQVPLQTLTPADIGVVEAM